MTRADVHGMKSGLWILLLDNIRCRPFIVTEFTVYNLPQQKIKIMANTNSRFLHEVHLVEETMLGWSDDERYLQKARK